MHGCTEIAEEITKRHVKTQILILTILLLQILTFVERFWSGSFFQRLPVKVPVTSSDEYYWSPGLTWARARI